MPTTRPRIALAAALLAAGAALALAACTAPAPSPTDSGSPTPTAVPTDSHASGPGAAACVEAGGVVETRQPTWGTNSDPSQWVELGDPIDVCRFQTLGDDADSRLYADLVTISSSKPTLAALAYLSKTQLEGSLEGNPASQLCVQLGGAISYGPSPAGGGLVNSDDPNDEVFAPCYFADGSFIDEWGIAYYAGDVVRGIDLTSVFAFDQSDLPPVFAG